MAHITADRVADTTTTTGTGALTVSGTAPSTFRTFSAVCSASDTIWYWVAHRTIDEWEVGLGTYSASNEITRTTVLSSSNGGAAVNFSAGTKDIVATLPASVISLLASNSTTSTHTAGTIELGHASDTTIARSAAGVATIEGVEVVTLSRTQTLTNKTLTSPVLTTPDLGTPSALTLTNATGLPVASGISGTGTGVLTALAVNVGSAGAFLTFDGAGGTPSSLTLTNATGLPVAGISASTSTALGVGSVELGHASDTTIARGAAGKLTVEGAYVKLAGTETIYIPAGAMVARTTNGAASGSVETTTNKVMLKTLDFDTTTQEFAQFSVRMPKSWDESTVTAVFTWSHPSTTINFGVVWALQGIALSNDDAGDTAFGTEQVIADTGGTTNDVYVTSATPAITIGGTPAAEDWVVFQVKRVPANGSDTMAVDARLHGVTLYITTNDANDA